MASRTHQEDGDDNPYDKYKNQKEEYRSWFHSHYTFAISLILIAAAHYCYFQSLEGGNDVQVKSRLLHIGLNLLGSCVFFLAGLYLFVVKVGIARPIKGLILTIIALSMGWVLTYDLGTSFMNHGEYNLIAFVAINVGVVSVWSVVYVIYKSHFKKHLLVAFFVALFLLSTSAIRATNHWGDGVLGEHLKYETKGCSLPRGNIPVIELWPRRLFNFFMGSEKCSSVPVFSKLEAGILTVNCGGSSSSNSNNKHTATYVTHADFVSGRQKFEEYEDGKVRDTTEMYRLWQTQVSGKTQSHTYTEPVRVKSEYVQVFCAGKENFHVQNVRNDRLFREARVAQLKQRHSLQAQLGRYDNDDASNSTDNDNNILGVGDISNSNSNSNALSGSGASEVKKHPGKMNVLVILIDALSRAHAIRRLPKTFQVLEKLDDRKGGDFHLFQFFRYHILGCCTRSNLRPLVAGFGQNYNKQNLEPYLFWNAYKWQSYVTMFANNLCQDYLVTYFGLSNTSLPDHEAVLPFCHPEYSAMQDMYSNFRGPYSINKRCIAGKHVHNYMFDYTRQFFNNYEGTNRLAFTLFSEAHEGTGAVVSQMDQDLADFIEDVTTNHPNTAIFFMSDHGLHVGPYWLTSEAGRLEHRLPLLNILLPSSFLSLHPEVKKNLQSHQQTLITSYDIYRTLLHIPSYPQQHILQQHHPVRYGSSLFGADISEDTRTCETSGVSQTTRCSCVNEQPVT